EEHVGERTRRRTRADGRRERALRTFVVADVDELAEQARQPLRLELAGGKRIERKARRLTGGVGCDIRDPVVERGGTIGRLEPARQVHQAAEGRKAAEPAAAAALDAKGESVAEDLDATRIGLEERDRRLRKHEWDIALESVVQ